MEREGIVTCCWAAAAAVSCLQSLPTFSVAFFVSLLFRSAVVGTLPRLCLPLHDPFSPLNYSPEQPKEQPHKEGKERKKKREEKTREKEDGKTVLTSLGWGTQDEDEEEEEETLLNEPTREASKTSSQELSYLGAPQLIYKKVFHIL